MITLDNAVVYDIETLPNVFTLAMEMLNDDRACTWEISQYRDDRAQLMQWFNWLQQTQTPMIGFNSVGFDYIVCHLIFMNPNASIEMIYAKAQAIIDGNDRFGHMVWDRDRFAPQIDLFKVHHFDNKAKTTSLKALQINMRSETVVDSPVQFGTYLSLDQVNRDLIPYNKHDVKETKRFAHYSMDAIKFRIGLINQFGIQALNFSDVKIGAQMFQQKLGDDICYDRSTGRKQMRQTPRYRIALSEIIFPSIQFRNPEFQRVLDFMRGQVLTPEDLDDPDSTIKTKGVFNGVTAHVGGVEFVFGTGGVHASVEKQRFIASDEWEIHDIDVEALYPSIAIANGLAPEHLGDPFRRAYPEIKAERKKYAKGTYDNAALKLANNGPWGQSNNKYSVFYDPKYAMTIPINGQLMICMLAEWLVSVPTLQLIQANTDGITYRIHRDYQPQAKALCEQWETYTHLTLEYAKYNRMWIRDVNNYVAEDTKGKLKQKGAYWHPDPLDYANSISTASPPCWYKDFNPVVVQRAAVAAMVHGVDPGLFIRLHTDPFDFMLRAKVDRSSTLMIGGVPIQRTTRYYVARDGAGMTIERPPAGPLGMFKRKNGVTDAEYRRVMEAGNWAWNEAVCTGKAGKPETWGKYERRITSVQAGWKIAECNNARSFRFDNVDYDFYINEANKLIIA